MTSIKFREIAENGYILVMVNFKLGKLAHDVISGAYHNIRGVVAFCRSGSKSVLHCLVCVFAVLPGEKESPHVREVESSLFKYSYSDTIRYRVSFNMRVGYVHYY